MTIPLAAPLELVAAPGIISLASLSDEEKATLGRLRGQLNVHSLKNALYQGYYEARNRVRDLGISIPPQLRDLEIAAGWPGTAIDVLDERLFWDNYVSTGDLMGLDEIYQANHLQVEQGSVHLDALICGVSFVATGKGDATLAEPDVLITGESPMDCTVMWDNRQRRVVAAYSRTVNQRGTVTMESLYLLNETIRLERVNRQMVVVDRDQHNLNRVLVAVLPNRPRASRARGRSEITRTVRYVTDSVMRWLLGMEVNREFYTTPQRYLMGADKEAFVDDEGRPLTTWEARMGVVWTAPFGDDGKVPTAGEFTGQSPAPYATGIDVMRSIFATEVAIPPSYLGITTDNPASADAILRGETRLIKRSLRRQDSLGMGWWDTAYNALLVRDGKVDAAELRKASPDWLDPATPTPAAQADAAVKLVAAKILPPDSEITQRRIGLTDAERRILAAEQRRAAGRGVLQAITDAANAAQQPVANADAGRPA